MSILLFANNAKSQLASPITSTDTIVRLTPGTGSIFPSPSVGSYFKLTLTGASNPGQVEVTHCTARSGDTCTVIRGREGTQAQTFLSGDTVGNYNTSGTMDSMVQDDQLQTLQFCGATLAGTTTAIQATINSRLTTLPSVSSGLYFEFTGIASASNIGGATLTLNFFDSATGITTNGNAYPILRPGGAALIAGDITSGGAYRLTFNSATQTWLLNSFTVNAGNAAFATNALNLIDGGTIAGTVRAVTQPAGSGVATGNVFQPTGQTAGSFYAIAEGNGIILAGAALGIYRSTDGGLTFTSISATINPQALLWTGAQWLAATTAGLYKSTDNGVTWTLVSSVGIGFNVKSLINTGTAILAGTNANGVYRSTDGGNTFVQATGFGSTAINALVKIGTTIFGAGGGIWKSTNDGASWTVTSQATGSFSSIVSFGTKIYAGQFSSRTLLVSADNGVTWADGAVATNPNAMLSTGTSILLASAGGEGIWVSTDGASFAQTNITTGVYLCLASTSVGVFAGGVGILRAVSGNAVATCAYADAAAVGVGQQWRDVTSSRAIGVTYTNTSGKTIQLAIAINPVNNSSGTLYVNGVIVGYEDESGSSNTGNANMYPIVPAGATYLLQSTGTIGGLKWAELRY